MLGAAYFLPLLLSPLISILLTMPLYKLGHELSGRLGIIKQSCVCIAPGNFVPVAAFAEANAPPRAGDASKARRWPSERRRIAWTSTTVRCWESPRRRLIDIVHYVSAAAVSFARGLNDGPKIIGLLFVVKVWTFG